jgi:hypothetical protein
MSTYDAYHVIEDISSPQDRVLAFGAFQTYPLRRTSFVDFFWRQPILMEWADHASNARGLALKLKEEGVEYLLYQRQEAVLMSQKEKGFALGVLPEASYVEFWRYYAKPIFMSGNCLVYRVHWEPASGPYPLPELPGLQEKIIAEVENSADVKAGTFNEIQRLLRANPDWMRGKELERILRSKKG